MAKLTRDQYEDRLRALRLLVTDVDGVLTDGSIAYTGSDSETKVFNVKDGSAVYIARAIGLPVVVITARKSDAVARRFSELPVMRFHQDTFDKVAACGDAEAALEISPDVTAFVGDDLVDLPAMRRAGLGVAVADAQSRVLQEADWVLSTPGGRGALREFVDDVVTARGLWDTVLADYESRQARKGAEPPSPGSS
ncbi:MAG: HAD hydrolase family protein [Acidobacteria bacterium]|nr:HAD hydrolase family protein [Acidobacteriota bacterium]